MTLLLLIVALTYKPFRSPLEEMFEVKREPAPFFDLSIWQNKAFCVYTAAVALFMLGYFIPFVHLVCSPHCFITIPLGSPIVLFLSFRWEPSSISLLHPGSSHRFVSGTWGQLSFCFLSFSMATFRYSFRAYFEEMPTLKLP